MDISALARNFCTALFRSSRSAWSIPVVLAMGVLEETEVAAPEGGMTACKKDKGGDAEDVEVADDPGVVAIAIVQVARVAVLGVVER